MIIKERLNKTKWIMQQKYKKVSYSQEGEDFLLQRIFGEKDNGFYVDIGAHHPYRFSNTTNMYKRGWNGINIEPNPEGYKLIDKMRKRDINLNCACGLGDEKIKYYIFEESADNTCDSNLAQYYIDHGVKLCEKVEIPTVRLDKILDSYLPQGKTIDFLDVDVEGFEIEVFMSNNWDKYRPKIIMTEVDGLTVNIDELKNNKVISFLEQKDYYLVSKLFNTVILCDKKNPM